MKAGMDEEGAVREAEDDIEKAEAEEKMTWAMRKRREMGTGGWTVEEAGDDIEKAKAEEKRTWTMGKRREMGTGGWNLEEADDDIEKAEAEEEAGEERTSRSWAEEAEDV